MAEALAKGFLDKKVIEAGDIWCCDPSKARMDVFADLGCNTVKNAAEVWSCRHCCLHVDVSPSYVPDTVHRLRTHTEVCAAHLLQISQHVDVIFISVKPQYVGVVIKEMKPHLNNKHILVSIAAGIPLSVMKVRLFALHIPCKNLLIRHSFISAEVCMQSCMMNQAAWKCMLIMGDA